MRTAASRLPIDEAERGSTTWGWGGERAGRARAPSARRQAPAANVANHRRVGTESRGAVRKTVSIVGPHHVAHFLGPPPQLAFQGCGGAVLAGRKRGVEREVRPAPGPGKVPELSVRLGDLMVHVDHDRRVDRIARQPRVRGLASDDGHVGQAGLTHPVGEQVQVLRNDILTVHMTGRTHAPRHAGHVVAIAGADVGHGHPREEGQVGNDGLGLAGGIACAFVGPARSDNAGEAPAGSRKGVGREPARVRGPERIDLRAGLGRSLRDPHPTTRMIPTVKLRVRKQSRGREAGR
jgi:hypothetical protein